MGRRLSLIGLILLLILVACRSQGGDELLRSGRQHVEASECVGVDRYAEAIADLEKALEADPGLVEAYYWLYEARSRGGDAEGAEKALADLEAAVAAGQSGPEGRFWLLKLYVERGDEEARDQALSVLEAQVQSTPGDADGHFWLGRAYYELGQVEQALQSFQSAVTMDPEHVLAHFWLGQVYTEQGRPELALQEFDTVLRLDPNNVAALHNRGVVAYQMGDLDRALEDLEAALAEDPDDPGSHYQLGAVYLARAVPETPVDLPDADLLEKAQAEFEQALELCPGMPEPLIGLGNLHLVEGDPAAAIEPLKQALEQVEDSPQAWFALGQAYAALGQGEKACDAFDRFLALSPPPEWAEQAEQIREQLGCP